MEQAVMRKSPSVTSSTSVEAFVPRRRKLSRDKDCLSMHSEKMTTIYRRFSLANGRGYCKVGGGQPSVVESVGKALQKIDKASTHSKSTSTFVLRVVSWNYYLYAAGTALSRHISDNYRAIPIAVFSDFSVAQRCYDHVKKVHIKIKNV